MVSQNIIKCALRHLIVHSEEYRVLRGCQTESLGLPNTIPYVVLYKLHFLLSTTLYSGEWTNRES